MTEECAYCGDACSDKVKFCGECWQNVPGELKDRVTEAFCQDPYGPRFVNAVEGALKFLMWLDEPEGT